MKSSKNFDPLPAKMKNKINRSRNDWDNGTGTQGIKKAIIKILYIIKKKDKNMSTVKMWKIILKDISRLKIAI